MAVTRVPTLGAILTRRFQATVNIDAALPACVLLGTGALEIVDGVDAGSVVLAELPEAIVNLDVTGAACGQKRRRKKKRSLEESF